MSVVVAFWNFFCFFFHWIFFDKFRTLKAKCLTNQFENQKKNICGVYVWVHLFCFWACCCTFQICVFHRSFCVFCIMNMFKSMHWTIQLFAFYSIHLDLRKYFARSKFFLCFVFLSLFFVSHSIKHLNKFYLCFFLFVHMYDVWICWFKCILIYLFMLAIDNTY